MRIKLFKVIILLLVANISVLAQEVDPQLLLKAKARSPEVMYQVALALENQDASRYGKEAVKWLERSSNLNYPPAQALLAYHFIVGFNVEKDLEKGRHLAAQASANNEGLASWLMAQLLPDNKSNVVEQVQKAYEAGYPLAILYYAKLYATGSEDFGIARDTKESDRLLMKASAYRIPYVDNIMISRRTKNHPDLRDHIDYLKSSVEGGNPYYKSLLASCYHYGQATIKDDPKVYSLFSEAAENGDPLVIEGLADCLRMGISVVPDQHMACQLYETVAESSPRAMYLLACYYNEGIAIGRDKAKSLVLFERSANAGYVFSQAILGISLYTGASPCGEKNQSEAYKYLSAAIRNKYYEYLPDDVKSQVCEYAAACLRYGFGTDMNVGEADRLYERSVELRSGVSLSRSAFGLVDVMIPEYCLDQMPVLSAADIPDNILNCVTLDYPIGGNSEMTNAPLGGQFSDTNGNVAFSDANLKQALLKTIDKSGDGEIFLEEMAAVFSLEALKLDKGLRSFEEFAHFKGVKEIPELYFQGFSHLASISIPESVEVIKDNAFLGCSSLAIIELPASVASIGNWAFAYCGKLRTLICKSDVPPVVGEDFLSNTKDVVIYVPAGVVSDYKKSVGWSQHSKRIKPLSSK